MQNANLSLPPTQPIDTGITEIMKDVATGLRAFLARTLPAIRADWWPALVTANLTEPQLYILKKRRLETLDSLDLAALLRVFKRNFDDIDQRVRLPWGLRNWLKEMQGIRNKYAHESGEPATVEDQWRDLDTAQRFAASIGANHNLLNTIAILKNRLFQPKYSAPQAGGSTQLEDSTHAWLASSDGAIFKSDTAKDCCVLLVYQSIHENHSTATTTAP